MEECWGKKLKRGRVGKREKNEHTSTAASTCLTDTAIRPNTRIHSVLYDICTWRVILHLASFLNDCCCFFGCVDDANCGGDEYAILSTDDQRCVEKIINIVTEQEVAPSVKSVETCGLLWAIQILNPFCKEAK